MNISERFKDYFVLLYLKIYKHIATTTRRMTFYHKKCDVFS